LTSKSRESNQKRKIRIKRRIPGQTGRNLWDRNLVIKQGDLGMRSNRRKKRPDEGRIGVKIWREQITAPRERVLSLGPLAQVTRLASFQQGRPVKRKPCE